MEAFQRESVYPLRAIWPSEREDAQSKIIIAVSDRATEEIVARMKSFHDRLANGDSDALLDMHSFQASTLFDKIVEEKRNDVWESYWQRVDEILGAHFENIQKKLTAISDHHELLRFSKNWYEDYASGWLCLKSEIPFRHS